MTTMTSGKKRSLPDCAVSTAEADPLVSLGFCAAVDDWPLLTQREMAMMVKLAANSIALGR